MALRFTWLPIIVCVLLVLCSGASYSQDSTQQNIEALKSEIQRLRAQVDSLRAAAVSPEYSQDEGDLERLDERLDEEISRLENKIDAVSRSVAPIVYNPRLTAFLNVAARVDNEPVMDAEGVAEISNRSYMRTVELDFRGTVDPYSEAIVILAIEDEAGTGYAIDPEEAYGVLTRLPILETAPLGLKLKAGKYRAPLGVNNKLHMHDLPWTTRPLVISRFLGTEHGEFFESGFNPVGIDLDFFLPNPIPATTLEMNFDVLRSGEIALAEGRAGRQPSYLAHLTLSGEWNNEHLLTLGASGYTENGEHSTDLLGFDLTYKWSPSEGGRTQSFVAGGELFTSRLSSPDPEDATVELTSYPYGWFGYLQYQLSFWTFLGARYDWVKEPFAEDIVTRNIGVYASYYTTEFLRLRVGYEHRQSDLPVQDGVDTALFELNFVFGSHPTEPYWVSR